MPPRLFALTVAALLAPFVFRTLHFLPHSGLPPSAADHLLTLFMTHFFFCYVAAALN